MGLLSCGFPVTLQTLAWETDQLTLFRSDFELEVTRLGSVSAGPHLKVTTLRVTGLAAEALLLVIELKTISQLSVKAHNL